jgi:hypothetical protein
MSRRSSVTSLKHSDCEAASLQDCLHITDTLVQGSPQAELVLSTCTIETESYCFPAPNTLVRLHYGLVNLATASGLPSAFSSTFPLLSLCW